MHLIIPTLVLTALGYKRRYILSMLPFAWLPDIGFIFGLHRLYTTNIFFLGSALLLFYSLLKVYKIKDANTLAKIAIIMVASHIILDLEAVVALFYPLYPKYIYIESEILIARPNFNLIPNFKVHVLDIGDIAPTDKGNVLTTTGSLIGLFTALMLLYEFRKRSVNKGS